jgi:GMP synthase-like glutamine amidotransferase
MHRDIVCELPFGCELLASSEKCKVQGFYRPRSIFTVQAHPEFNEDIMTRIVTVRAGQGVFSPDVADEALRRAATPQDGMLVGAAIVHFLLER